MDHTIKGALFLDDLPEKEAFFSIIQKLPFHFRYRTNPNNLD